MPLSEKKSFSHFCAIHRRFFVVVVNNSALTVLTFNNKKKKKNHKNSLVEMGSKKNPHNSHCRVHAWFVYIHVLIYHSYTMDVSSPISLAEFANFIPRTISLLK